MYTNNDCFKNNDVWTNYSKFVNISYDIWEMTINETFTQQQNYLKQKSFFIGKLQYILQVLNVQQSWFYCNRFPP